MEPSGRSESRPRVVTPARRRRQTEAERRRASRAAISSPSLPATLDGGVLTATAILASIGVVMIYSTTAPLSMGHAVPPHFTRHLAAVLLATLCAAVTLRIPLQRVRQLARPFWIASVALLVLTLVAGVEVNGAERWLAVPGTNFRFQPAEIAKLATVLVVASTLAGGRIERRNIQRTAVYTAIPAALLLQQPDLGNAGLVIALVGLLLFVAGAPLRRLLVPSAIAALGAAAFVAWNPYTRRRVTGFLDPWAHADDEGFQLVQSFVAFGRGGSLGVGVGDGRQKLGFLPEAHTDFILSGVAEELGLVGVLLVLGAFAALAVVGTRIARRSPDRFAALVAFGATSLLVVPAAVNAAVVMGLLPTTGFTLPFLSYGRTSLVICGIAVGLILRAASREAAPAKAPVARERSRGRATRRERVIA